MEYEEAFHEASHSEHVEEKLDLMNAVNRLPKNTKTSSFKNIFWKCLWRKLQKQMIPENTVKTNLSRARAALKKMLKEDYFEDS